MDIQSTALPQSDDKKTVYMMSSEYPPKLCLCQLHMLFNPKAQFAVILPAGILAISACNTKDLSQAIYAVRETVFRDSKNVLTYEALPLDKSQPIYS